jgi:hypothetical protein
MPVSRKCAAVAGSQVTAGQKQRIAIMQGDAMANANEIMFQACIAHGNPNNYPLITRHAEVARMQIGHKVAQIVDEAHDKVDAILGNARPFLLRAAGL